MTTTFAVPLFFPADLVGKSFRSQDWWQQTDDSSYLKNGGAKYGKTETKYCANFKFMPNQIWPDVGQIVH